MIKISNLSKSFSGQTVLNHLNLDIQKGEVVALIGSSGAGKSTFLRSLNYLETPDSGTIQIDNFKVDFSQISQEEILTLRRKLSMVFQQFNLFERRTALDNVKEGLVVVKNYRTRKQQKSLRKSWPRLVFLTVKTIILATYQVDRSNGCPRACACYETRCLALGRTHFSPRPRIGR